MTKQIATGRAGRAYEIAGDPETGVQLFIDNEPTPIVLTSMEAARRMAMESDAQHHALTWECVPVRMPLTWVTVAA